MSEIILNCDPSELEGSSANFGVEDIAGAGSEILMSREEDDTTITLWLNRNSLRRWVTVEDFQVPDEPLVKRFEITEGVNPIDKETGKFWFPFDGVAYEKSSSSLS